MLVFAAQTHYQAFAEEIAEADADAVLGTLEAARFPNREIRAAVHENVANEDCLVIGTIAPPDTQLAEFLMLADALRHSGARSICAFLPYTAYARQDKFAPGEGGGIAAIGSLFRAVGIDSIVTIDLHSELDTELIGMPVVSLSPARLFAGDIRALGWPDATVVAPDEGAIRRSEDLADALGVHKPVAYLVKEHRSVVHLKMVGEPGERVVIADDILDSGQTLVSACSTLRQNGAKEIAVAVTHGLFTGEIWRKLFGLGVVLVLVSDSCPEAFRAGDPRIKVVSISSLLPSVLAAARKEPQNVPITV